jgi:hypothetical protein
MSPRATPQSAHGHEGKLRAKHLDLDTFIGLAHEQERHERAL